MRIALFCLAVVLSFSSVLARMESELPKFQKNGLTSTLYLLPQAAARLGAVCLDGTPPGYYFRPGTDSGANKWYIHHEGGGWCENDVDCLGRSKTGLGSSNSYPASQDIEGGYLDTNPAVNPQMYNWNSVYIKYCDGGSFSGNNATVTVVQGTNIYYRGFRILNAIIDDLLTNRGLTRATDAVISGCSAGGLSTFLHVDTWAAHLTHAKVRGMPDSGFFLDYQGPPGYHAGLQWVFNQMNSTSGVNQDCIRGNAGETWKCIFAEHTSPFIKTPIFPLQGIYDSWQIPYDLGSNDVQMINQWGTNLTSLVKNNLLSNPVHGVFLDSCFHHCGAWNSIRINGKLVSQAFAEWYDGTGPHDFLQNQAYPCQACCQPNL